MSKVAIVYHSGYGHTAVVANAVAEGVAQGGAEPVLLKIEGPGQDFGPLLAAIDDADAVVFGSPTYMGDVSAAFRAFAEASSKALGAWKDKLAAGFTNSGSLAGDKLQALSSLSILASQHGMVWVGSGVAGSGEDRLGAWLGLTTQSDNAPSDVTPPEGDRAAARRFGARLAAASNRWARGGEGLLAQAA